MPAIHQSVLLLKDTYERYKPNTTNGLWFDADLNKSQTFSDNRRKVNTVLDD